MSPKLRTYPCFPGKSARQGKKLGILGVYPKHDLGKVAFRTPGTERRRLSLLCSRQNKPEVHSSWSAD